MNQTLHQTLHYELLKLRDRAKAWLEGDSPEGFDPAHGICPNLDRELEKPLHDLIERWPGASGRTRYPIEDARTARANAEARLWGDRNG